MSLAAVRDLRESRVPATPEELADFETDVPTGFVLARAAAGLADGTIREPGGYFSTSGAASHGYTHAQTGRHNQCLPPTTRTGASA